MTGNVKQLKQVKLKLKKGDTVIVVAGKDKGVIADVVESFPKQNRVIVAGVNMVKKHQKPNPQKGERGGIVSQEASIHASNVQIYNPNSKKADRIRYSIDESGQKTRVFASDSNPID